MSTRLHVVKNPSSVGFYAAVGTGYLEFVVKPCGQGAACVSGQIRGSSDLRQEAETCLAGLELMSGEVNRGFNLHYVLPTATIVDAVTDLRTRFAHYEPTAPWYFFHLGSEALGYSPELIFMEDDPRHCECVLQYNGGPYRRGIYEFAAAIEASGLCVSRAEVDGNTIYFTLSTKAVAGHLATYLTLVNLHE